MFVNFVKFVFLLLLSFNCDVVVNKYEEKKYLCFIVRFVIVLKREEGVYGILLFNIKIVRRFFLCWLKFYFIFKENIGFFYL